MSRGRNKFFCSTDHFWCWCKSHCRSLIEIKGSAGAVSPLFVSIFAGSFPHFSYEEVLDFQKINLFTLLFNISHIIQYVSQKILFCIAILFLTPLKFKAEQGWHFCKAIIPRGLSMSSQTLYNTLYRFDIKSKTSDFVIPVNINWTSASGSSEFHLTLGLVFRSVYL